MIHETLSEEEEEEKEVEVEATTADLKQLPTPLKLKAPEHAMHFQASVSQGYTSIRWLCAFSWFLLLSGGPPVTC